MAKRWRRNPRPTGLAGVCAGVQGSTLYDGDVELANVNHANGVFDSTGWYWACPSNESLGIGWANSCNEKVETEKEAKAQAKSYIDKCLKQSKGK